MLKNLYIFEPTVDFGQVDSTSTLLDCADIKLTKNQYHTSLGDLTPQQILSIVNYFDTITFIDQGFDKQSNLYNETLILLNFLQHFCKIINFVKDDTVNFINNREIYQRPNVPVLWALGCSHSHGVGLDTFDQCYSSILSKKINCPLKSITQPGSSTEWSLRHLMNANLQPGDTIVWQLTTPERFTKGIETPDLTREVMLKNGSSDDIDFFSDSQVFYHQINCLNIGLKFLRNQPVTVVVISLNNASLYYRCLIEYTKHPEYCYLPGFDVDYGNDGMHFGPNSHQNIADGLLKFLKR